MTAAAFTDWALLDLNGDRGFGGTENTYNLVVSQDQETTIDEVVNWIEADTEAGSVAPIAGADTLIPGGAAVTVNVPIKNLSRHLGSTLRLSLEDITPEEAEAEQANAAYAELLRFEVAQVDDASVEPDNWQPMDPLAGAASGAGPRMELADLAANQGSIVVLRVSMLEGADQAATNVANGGRTAVQVRFDGESIEQ